MPKLCTLYTAGYGNQSPTEFVKRLQEHEINQVLDVRRKRSKSWCFGYWAGSQMEHTLACHAIGYEHVYQLGNDYDTLAEYFGWLQSSEPRRILRDVARVIGNSPESIFCLLCSEREAIVDEYVKCHRKYIADAIVKKLGDGWEVEHLV